MWILEKIRVSVERLSLPLSTEYSFRIGQMFGEKASKPTRLSLCPHIITPDNIPEFCIPPKIPSLPKTRSADQNGGAPVIRVSHCEVRGPVQKESRGEPLSPTIIQVESVDESPYDAGYSDEDSTNADPQSQAALSLPHMAKAQTCYGFRTLLESPHTRRKESLFHSEPGSLPLPPPRSRSSTCSRLSTSSSTSTSTSTSPSFSTSSFSLNALTSRLSPRSCALGRQGTLDSDTASSAESSPFGSPLLARGSARPSMLKALSHERLLSRSGRKALTSRNDSLSTEESSSTDNSPHVARRLSGGLLEALPNVFGLAPPSLFPMDMTLHRERVMEESMVPLGKAGSLRLSAEYCPDNQRLRVRLISAEGLYALSVDPKSINCSVGLALVPGKLQKQRSTVIRKSRNPIFNEDFFFDCIAKKDICQRSLRFKVVNKMSTMKRDYILGNCDVPLSSIVTL